MRKTYVVMDYDTVTYAGNNLKDAQSKVKGGGRIDVWITGRWSGWYTYTHNKWVYKSI